MSPRRILLCTLGSLGDLHPYLALARALAARGHHAAVATSEFYRERVLAEGVGFHPVRPDLHALLADPGSRMARYMDARRGSERVARELVMPYLAESYADTLAAAQDVDLVVAHPLTLTARMAAETLGKPWIFTVLAPVSFLSASDPPVFPGMAWTESLRGLPEAVHRVMLDLAVRLSAGWFREVHTLRAQLGLPPAGHPMFDGAVSPFANLGLFSPRFGPPQSDWPAHTRATGFCFLDHPQVDVLPENLQRFLAAGPPPVVCTLGTSAIFAARDFYVRALAHARSLGRRVVLLVGREMPRSGLDTGDDALVIDYAPYSRVFPHAAAIVHQGGAGTTAEALRSGRPMLVVPFSHDQFDNAARVRRMGSGDTIDRDRWGAVSGRRRLERLLTSESIAGSAAENGARIRAEDGPGQAIEVMLEAIEGSADMLGPGVGAAALANHV